MIRVALAGNPNSGKTTLFNSLTGSTAHVGNWPGVTVDKKEGVYKKTPEPMQIIDLPGIYSLSPYTPEEVISRNYILDEKPDCIINIVDATNLERNLYLTTQLMEIDVPIVVALNMMDTVTKNGDVIDSKKLEQSLGVPVVEISALKEKGFKELTDTVYTQAQSVREGETVLGDTKLKHLINDVKIALKGIGVESPLFHSVKLIENDEIEVKRHTELLPMIDDFKSTFSDDVFGSDFEAIIADGRYKYISENYSKVLTKKIKEKHHLTKSDKADRILTHKYLGIPIFLLILFAIFHLTFSSNLLFLKGALHGATTLEGVEYWEGLVLNGDGLNSPGVFLQSVMIGLTDLIGGSLKAALVTAPAWVQGLLVDGIWAGISAVMSFIPQILLLFLFFSILEDSGYMARVAFILDRIFRKFGLSGRAFMPMIMGFGCSIPAMINTRTLADEKERTATIRVIPFFSCGAKLPILTAIAGALVTMFGTGNADWITYGMYLIGITVAICSVILMRSTTLKGETPPFIMELPAYHLPQPKNLAIHLWDKLKHYVKKAFTIIFASTIVIWFLSNFGWNWQMVDDIGQSILAGIGQLVTPLFTPLGFGSQLHAFSWVFVVAAVTGLIAKENVISTFAVLAAVVTGGALNPEALNGIQSVEAMITATGIGIPGLLAFIVFNMTTIPCFAAVATAKAELPKNRYRSTLLFWIVTSYIAASMIYIIGSWWWTVFIFIAAWGLIITLIILNNKGVISLGRKKCNR